MLRNKSITIFIKTVFAPLLFLWLAYSIYTQLQQQPHLRQSWQHIKNSFISPHIWVLGAVVLLMLANWSVEAVKWKLSVSMLQPVSFFRALRAVLSGVSLSVSMPNRIGESAGRVLYLPEGSRLKALSASSLGSSSQLLITLIGGLVGLYILKQPLLQAGLLQARLFWVFFFSTLLVAFILTVLYFGIRRWGTLLERWLQHSRYLYLVQALQGFNASLLLQLLLLSALRYTIFTLQYVLLFSFFKVHIAAYLLWCTTAVLFLVIAIIPTIALAEVGVRGQVSLQLLGLFTTNSLGVVLASVTAWAINLIVPALAGSLLILTLKVFKRTHEVV